MRSETHRPIADAATKPAANEPIARRDVPALKQVKILLVEDRAEDVELMLRALRKAGLDVECRVVESAAQLEETLTSFSADVIVSDYSLPLLGGMQALEIAKQMRPDTPFIFSSGTIGEDRAIEALKHGAIDYVLKDNLARMAPAVLRAMEVANERRERRRAQSHLKESEARFRSAMHYSSIGMSLVGLDGQWQEVNPALCKILGYSEAELLDGAFQKITHPDDAEKHVLATQSLLNREIDHFDVEKRYVVKKGRVIWVSVSVSVIWKANGEPHYFISQTQDITERRTQQERINRLSRMHAVLSNVNATIVRTKSRDVLLREACRIAVQHGGFKLAWIALTDPETSKLRPVISEGDDDGYLEDVARAMRGRDQFEGISGKALLKRTVVVANDIATDENVAFKKEALARGYRSLASLPLLAGDEAIGVLALYADELNFFDADEIRLLKELAGDISLALDYIAKRERLEYVSYYDALTGLANRKLFLDRVTQSLGAGKVDARNLTVMIIEVQRFKSINETIGRNGGDRVLKTLANRLKSAVNDSSTPARVGGDRFALFLLTLGTSAIARLIDDWIIQSIVAPIDIDGVELRVTVKIGLAVYPADGEDADSLYANAEAAMNAVKQSSAQYSFYSQAMNADVVQSLHLESRLRKAVEHKEFVLYYQPKYELATRRICGLEALIRWRDPERGLVPPNAFIPTLEESGLIVDVGRWVIAQAAADTRAWRKLGLDVPRIAVNVSQLELNEADFVASVLAPLSTIGGDDAVALDIEITESLIAQNAEANVKKLIEIRQAGVRVFLDDFGTGYSSLSQVAQLPLDAIKIDRAFIMGMTTKKEHRAIVMTIVNLAQALNLFVVAEGVETEAQAALLAELRCNEVQGYLLSPPIPADEVIKLFRPAAAR